MVNLIHFRATVVFSSVLPRATNVFSTGVSAATIDKVNDESRRINEGLRKVASLNCYPDIEFVDHDVDFHSNGVIHRELLSRDGLHLSFRGTQTIVQRLESTLKRIQMDKSVTSQSICSNDVPKTSEESKSESDTACQSLTTVINPAEPPKTQLCTIPAIPTTIRCLTAAANATESATNHTVENKKMKENKKNTPRRRPLPTTPAPLGTMSTPWWMSAASPNIFEPLLIDTYVDHEDSYTVEDDEEETALVTTLNLISSSPIRTLLIGGGGGELSDTENDDEFPAVEYMQHDKKFKHSEAADLLEHPNVENISKFPPFQPKGGSVYIVSDRQDVKCINDWRSDGYTWRNYGKNKVTNGEKILEKSYFRIKNGKDECDNFQRVMYRFFGKDYNNLTLIQYLGDENEYKGQPHGNRKHGYRPHKRTMPSVLNKIKQTGDSNPKSVKDKIDSDNPVPLKLTGIHSVKNTKQVKNIQFNSRKDRRLGHDSLYNLHELMYHIDSYIHEIKTAPDLQVIVGYKDIFEEYDRLLQLKTEDPIPLYYDTTFCLGDFYVSTLAFQHITLVPEMGCFLVNGHCGKKYAVTLYPKETCQCPSTSRCYHIIAAMLAIGQQPGPDKKPINLSKLRKNSRARKDKKAGTKRGRKGDLDETIVNAAPDSILVNRSELEEDMSFALEMDEKIILSHSTPKTVNNQPDDTECNKNLNQSIAQHTNTLTIKTPKTPKVVIVSPVRTPKSILKKIQKNSGI